MWNGIVIVLLLGYLCMGRSFAYLGIPPWHVFIGEGVLGCFLLFGPRTVRGRWPWVAKRIPRLHNLVKVFLLFLLYGVFQVLHGIYGGNPPLTAFRDLAFNYYPLYFFLGLWVGLRNPEFLPRFIRLLAWFNGLYGLLFHLAAKSRGLVHSRSFPERRASPAFRSAGLFGPRVAWPVCF